MDFNWPVLVINLKLFFVGQEAQDYTLKAAETALKLEKPLIVCPNLIDLNNVVQRLQQENKEALQCLSIFSQKIDDANAGGKGTGQICLEALAQAQGSLLNHAENRLYGKGKNYSEKDFESLSRIIEKCANQKFPLIVCADSALTGQKIAARVKELGAEKNLAIAVEWDEFIGQRISMVEHKPEEIIKAKKLIDEESKGLPVYAGAGVEKPADVKKAVQEMGLQGVLAATGFTKAPNYNGNYVKAIEDVLSF